TAHLEDDIRCGPERGSAIDDTGACRAVSVVTEIRRVAGAGLHDDLEAQLDELLDDLRHRGDAFFSRRRLSRYPYDLRHDAPRILLRIIRDMLRCNIRNRRAS